LKKVFPILFCILFLTACSNSSAIKKEKTSLYKFGIPAHIKAPENARFNKASSGNIESLSVVDDDGFNLQVLSFPASVTDEKTAKQHQREQVVSHPDFSKIIEDYDQGFLFELEFAGDRYYDFRYVKIVGNKEIIFQAGPTCQCDESQVRNMLQAIQ
jgi:hypothetical protein